MVFVIGRRKAIWLGATAAVAKKYCLGVAVEDTEEFLLPGDHKSRSVLCSNGALAVSSWQENAVKSSLEDGGRSGWDRRS